MAPEPSPIAPGTLLAGKYRVERVIGTGGMGVVVAARHEQLEELVAIKLLRAERIGQKDAVERALREARAAVKIQSDHVARVFDVGTLEDGSPYIVMEHLSGCDLAQLLCAEGSLGVEDATSYVLQACDAIGKAHALGIVHRDLKPANLFLAVRGDDDATIKVLDFGISKLAATEGRAEAALTNTSALMGSPVYMSPEQLESTRDVDARSDVWSLGVILYELLTGQHPFTAESLPQLCKKITEQPAPLLREARKDAPAELEAIVARCLAKRKDDRFQDVASLARALAPFARREGGESSGAARALAATQAADAARAGSGERVRVQAATPVAIPSARQPGTRARAGLLALVAVAVTSAALAMGSLGVKMKRDGAAAALAAVRPLDAPSSVLACPQLAASGVGEPSGWLGGAAASIVCIRAQARMGGRTARVLAPPELLDLPRMPVDDFPVDPFGGPAARDRAVAAAKARAAAYVDGEVVREHDSFKVTLIVRASADGRELARGEGTGSVLPLAIRAAMAPAERSGAIPSAPDADPFLLEWYRVRSADAAVASADRMLAGLTDTSVTEAECARFLARDDLLPDLRRVATDDCDQKLERPAAATPWARDTSSPGALYMSLAAAPDSAASDVALVEAALAKTTEPEARALLLVLESDIFQNLHDLDRAGEVALRSLHEDPKAFDGATGSAWQVLSWLHSNRKSAAGATAWAPWSPEAYCFGATQTNDPDMKVRYARRDHVLSPAKLWTETLVENLIGDGKRDEARAVAAEAHETGLRVQVEASDAHFGRALAIAHDGLSRDDGSSPYDAYYAASSAAGVSLVLDRPADYVAPLVARYLDPEPNDLSRAFLTPFMATVSCATAPRDVARHCFDRLHAIVKGPVAMMDGVLEGAERFAQHDYAGAAAAWRTMLSRPGWQLDGMRDLVAIALEHSGQTELAETVDAPTLAKPGRFNGVELAHVRAARRAEKRGDREAARKLAQQVIDAWSVADVDVPAVAEMRKLVARLK